MQTTSESSPVEPSTAIDELDQSRSFLAELLERMGFELTVDAHEDEHRISLDIDGEDARELVGKKGQVLDALQYLVVRRLSRYVNEPKSVVVDSGQYRKRREVSLCEMAQRLADKVIASGKGVAVNPMSAHDRRVIHTTLKDVPGVSTRSEGDGPERRILILPVDQ